MTKWACVTWQAAALAPPPPPKVSEGSPAPADFSQFRVKSFKKTVRAKANPVSPRTGRSSPLLFYPTPNLTHTHIHTQAPPPPVHTLLGSSRGVVGAF
jgi:hypothetical protein